LRPAGGQLSDMTIARPANATPSFWIGAALLGIAAAVAFHLAPSLGVAFDEKLKATPREAA
jgi:hypothetical protein